MIKIPGELGWTQNNRGDTLGAINQSFNLNLSSNIGAVRLTRTKRLASTGSPTNFGEVVGIERFLRTFFVAAENGSGDDIWDGGNAPFDTLTNDASSVEIVPSRTDMLAWNAGLYVTNTTEIFYTTDGSAWNEIGSNVLTGNGGLLTAKNDVLYVSDEHYKVKSVTSGNSFQGSGSQTLNLNLPGYTISVLMAGIDSIWVGLSNRDGSGTSLVFEWDGEAENTPTARYEVEASALMAGIIKDGIPYLVDSRGRLLMFSGGVFIEVDRFPLNDLTFKGFNDASNNGRAIHPRGMAVDSDEILMCVASRAEDLADTTTYNLFPSGVWAYSERTGLYHKFSPSYQAKDDTGTTGITDYGQVRCFAGGPLMVFEAVEDGVAGAAAGRVVFGMTYFTDAADASSDTEFGLFADDTRDDTQKAGWVVSPRLLSAQFRDQWEKVYAAISDLVTSGDLVEIKYRTKDETPTFVTGTWTGDDRFSTPTSLSAYEQGDEVTIVQGKGAGAVAHVRSLSSDAGSDAILDRSIPGVTIGETATFKLEKWKKVGSITDIASTGFSLGVSDHWIQIKLYMQWTGPRELYGILINNSSSLS